MNIKRLYCIYDQLAEAIYSGAIFEFPNDASAVRMFTEAYNHERSDVHKHPKDYVLMEVTYVNHAQEGDYSDDGTPRRMHQVRVVLTGEALHAASTPSAPPQLVKES